MPPFFKSTLLRILLATSLFNVAIAANEANLRPFGSGEKWAAVGDSITHGGGWLEYILTYSLCGNPGTPFFIFNLGSGGDAIHLALNRLDWDVINRKPDIVTLMFGINDVWHEHVGATLRGDYIKSMRKAVSRLQKAGVEVWLITPPPYDNQSQSDTPLDPQRSGLEKYVSELKTLAESQKLPLINFYDEMRQIAAEQQKFDPQFTLFGKDRVHLKPSGNFVMADIFLRSQDAISPDNDIELRVKGETLMLQSKEDIHFEFLGKKENTWSFRLQENCLPFPQTIIPPKARLLDTAIAASNRHPLRITGLEKANYLIKIDGVEIGSFTQRNLEKGIHLSSISAAPQTQQAEALAALIHQWNEIYRKKLRYCVMMEYGELRTHLPDNAVNEARLLVEGRLAKIKDLSQQKKQRKRFEEYLRYKAMQSKLQQEADALYAKILQQAKPRQHHFEIIKTNAIPGMKFPISTNLRTFSFPSPFLGEEGYLTVLETPNSGKKNKQRFSGVLYVMPCTSKKAEGSRVLTLIEQSGINKKHKLLVVQPRFDVTPWGANHASDPEIQHERHMIEMVIPFIEKTYFDGKRVPRYLIGFSKSGWSALSLLLKNPSVFEKAAAWDTPALLEDKDFGIWGTADNMGTLESFHAFHPVYLAAKNAVAFQSKPRIIWGGSDLFGSEPGRHYQPTHTEGFHKLMKQYGIRHYYFPNLNFRHGWNQGWFVPMVESMLSND